MSTQSMAQDDAGVVEVDGARLRYRIEGDGEPCLVVGSSVCYPRLFSPELRTGLRLVFADSLHFADPQHFASADPSFRPARITLDSCADDIELVRQALGLGDVVVIGHSVHACFALEHARRHPGHVRGAVVLCAAPRDDPGEIERLWEADASAERKDILARQLAELTPEVRAALSPAELYVREYVARGPMHSHDPAYDSAWLWDEVVPDMPVFERVAAVFDGYDLAEAATEIAVPVLIAHGRYDYANPYTLWEERRRLLPPQHSYVLFDKSGHFVPIEEPERFDQTLLEWVQGLAAPRA